MIFANIQVNGICANAVSKKLIPAGLIGGQVAFEFKDSRWDGLTKTVVFKGFGTKDVLLAGETAIIPAEVVQRSRVRLLVGIYGTDAQNTIAIPTLWADLGEIRDATDPSGDPDTDPQLPIWAQLQADITALKEQGVSDEQLAKVLNTYFEENPIDVPVQSVNGKTGSVKLTAADVGAIAEEDLQQATNEALVKAKESGAFDGPQGPQGVPGDDYVLTDEDKTEIAEQAAGLVEVPESGGIAVTGATVGQTVKIAAVDENGVPTAWESVDFPSGGANVTDEQVTEAVRAWLEDNPDTVSGGGRLAMEYVHDDSKLDYVIHITCYDSETGVWTTDGTVNLNEVKWSNYSNICLLDPEHKMKVPTTSGNSMKNLLPVLHGKVTVTSENTFTFSRTPNVTDFTPTDYVLIPNVNVTISDLPDTTRLRIVFEGQKGLLGNYSAFGDGSWCDPATSTTLAIKNGYSSSNGIYARYICDFHIEDGYIHGTVIAVHANNDGAGYDIGAYIPFAATSFPPMKIATYTEIGYAGLPYKFRVRIYDMEGEPWVF